ncbi:hypothetical protein NM688_g7656 [Phlebia brevispora]|uniref:Uncharacterized protein n=1 Tax=Phlebia brevispora TaxID=194682 RepID=A0ACC1S2N6_9APHY|nr:hypothetical protein NM688_g7656 [Phlebia brevispora]
MRQAVCSVYASDSPSSRALQQSSWPHQLTATPSTLTTQNFHILRTQPHNNMQAYTQTALQGGVEGVLFNDVCFLEKNSAYFFAYHDIRTSCSPSS